MAYDINAALERLEKNLLEVESAKRQVDETIATGESLQAIIGKYSEALDALNKDVSMFINEVHHYQTLKTSELESAINMIKVSCDGVVTKFKSDITTSTDSFNSKFAETINKFGSENGRFTELVNKLVSFQDSFNKVTNKISEVEKKADFLAKILQDSQKEQDKTLSDIKTTLNNLPASVKAQIDDVRLLINNHVSVLNSKADEIVTKANQTIQKLENINSVVLETKSICNGIKTDIDNLKSSVDSGIKTIVSTVNVNRWILIAGLILLAALHLVKF